MTSSTRHAAPARAMLFFLTFAAGVTSLTVSLSAQDRVLTPPELVEQGLHALREGVPRYDQDRIVEAADAFRRALALNPRYAEAHAGLAEALIWMRDYPQAAERIRRARDLRYSPVRLDLLEARLSVLTDRIDDARDLYRRVLEREPYNRDARVGDAILALAEGPTDTTLRRLRGLEQRFPESRTLLTALVEVAMARGESETADTYLTTALQYHADFPTVQLLAARFALYRDDPERAEFHARNAVSLAPTLEEAWSLLAHTAYRRGDYRAAKTHYEQLITLDPQNSRAWYARGVLASEAGDTNTAYRSWERAIRISPDYELARIARENTLIEREPLDSELRAEAARVYRESGNDLEMRLLHRQAERLYRRGLQLYPFDPVLRRSLADLHLARGFQGRFLQELRIIADLDSEELDREAKRELEELQETYENIRRDSLTARWNVDQFTAPRVRTPVILLYRQTPDTIEPHAGRHVAEYLAALLQTSQDIRLVSVEEAEGGSARTGAITRARDTSADLALLIEVEHGEETFVLDLELIRRTTGDVTLADTRRAAGVGRVDRAVRDAAALVTGIIQPTGTVVARRFERVLLSIGTVDGLDLDSEIHFFSADDAESFLGTGSVTELDDLLAEVHFTPEGPDTLTIRDVARIAPPPEEDREETDSGSGPDRSEPEQTARFAELLRRLFRLP